MSDKNDPAVILAALWKTCRVVFYPEAGDLRGNYPIEHAPGAGKDARQLIEARLAEHVLHYARRCPCFGPIPDNVASPCDSFVPDDEPEGDPKECANCGHLEECHV